MRLFSLAVTVAVFVLTVWMAIDRPEADAEMRRFQMGEAAMQDTFSLPWIPSFNIDYYMGLDGISFTLVHADVVRQLLSMGASWNITSTSRRIASCSCCWRRACWACSWRSISSCSMCSGK